VLEKDIDNNLPI